MQKMQRSGVPEHFSVAMTAIYKLIRGPLEQHFHKQDQAGGTGFMQSTLETFIRPAELSRKSLCLSSSIFNAYRLLISRDADWFVFLPLRDIQFQAIASSDEILFVDSFGPYYGDVTTGGRCISFAWQFADIQQRDSITHAADYEFVRYCDHGDVDNNRLVTEFSLALEYHRQNQLSSEDQMREANIINLRQ